MLATLIIISGDIYMFSSSRTFHAILILPILTLNEPSRVSLASNLSAKSSSRKLTLFSKERWVEPWLAPHGERLNTAHIPSSHLSSSRLSPKPLFSSWLAIVEVLNGLQYRRRGLLIKTYYACFHLDNTFSDDTLCTFPCT